MSVIGDIGSHGVSAGTHGIGVKTPSAAAVAAATSGLAKLVHIPNVGMLIGVIDMIVAAGLSSIITIDVGRTSRDAGARPNEQRTRAPMFTAGFAISFL
jgi:hypothetical protein